MNELKTFLQNKRNRYTFLGLLLMVAILPLGLYLGQIQQIFFSNAAGTYIQIGEGNCVTTDRTGNKALKCGTVPLVLYNPFVPDVPPEPTSLDEGVAAYFSFDEAEGDPEETITYNKAKANGTRIVEGKFGNARQFDINNDIEYFDSAAFNSPVQSVGAWVKPNQNAFGENRFPSVVNKRNNQNRGLTFEFTGYSQQVHQREQREGQMQCSWSNFVNESGQPSGIGVHSGDMKVEPNEWTYVLCSYDGEKIRMYFNGQKVGEETMKGRIVPNADWERGFERLVIGRNIFNTTDSFDGVIDEVTIWNRGLSDQEAQLLAEGTRVNPLIPYLAKDLVSHWRMDEQNPTTDEETITDSVGNNSGIGKKTKALADAINNNGRTFTASNSAQIEVNDSFSLNTPQFTVAAWVKPSSNLVTSLNAGGKFPSIINRRNATNSAGYTLEFTGYPDQKNGQIQCQLLSIGSLVSTVDKLIPDQWNHVACTYDGKEASLYINGMLSVSVLSNGALLNPTNAKIIIGKNLMGNQYFDGMMDEVALWKRGLTGPEIALLAKNKLPDGTEIVPQTPPTPPIAAICSPRPNVKTTSLMGATGLKVNLEAGTNPTMQRNRISAVKFTGLANATVKIGSQTYTQPVDIPIQYGTNPEFYVNQVTSGQATTVTLKAVDECGEFETFVGGGANIGWPGGGVQSPPPTTAPTPTPTPVPTPTPTAAPVACQPPPNNLRADVQIPGGRRITRTAGTNSNTPNNKFYTLKLTNFTGVRVDAYGRTYTSPSGVITIDVTQMIGGQTNLGPQPVDSVTFDIYPMTPGGAATLQFAITDSCRDWADTVGTGAAGAALYWGAGSAPPPINTNESSPTFQRSDVQRNDQEYLSSIDQTKASGSVFEFVTDAFQFIRNIPGWFITPLTTKSSIAQSATGAVIGLQSKFIPEANAQSNIVEISLFRLRNSTTQETTVVKQADVAALTSQGWANEGELFKAYASTDTAPTGVVPVYRLKNPSTIERFLTPQTAEVTLLTGNGWINEGIYFYAYPPDGITVPSPANVYRLKKANSQERLLTTQLTEVNTLVSQGWLNEGILIRVSTAAAATPTPTPISSASPQSTATASASASASASAISSATATASATAAPVQCTPGNFEEVIIEEGQNCGTITSKPASGATSGTIVYTAPNVSYSEAVCNLSVTTNNGGGCTLNTNGRGTSENALNPGETIEIQFSNQCTTAGANSAGMNSTGSNGCSIPVIVRPQIIDEPTPPTTGYTYKLAESEAALSNATEKDFDGNLQSFNATFILANDDPGVKQLWVEFHNLATGERVKDSINTNMLSEDPEILGVSCATPLGNGDLVVDISGKNLGTNGGQSQITVNGTAISKDTWENEYLKGTLKNPTPVANDGAQYDVEVTLSDGHKMPKIQCTVGRSMISLGTRLFCRGDGSFAVKGAKVMLIDEEGNKVEEMVDIAHNGMISGLKSILSDGKNYVISIKAPKLIRRNITFTALRGTTVLVNENGQPIVLPMGDIAPRPDGDGVVNTLDRSLMVNQWRAAVDATQPISADFNSDNRVNSFDWACMRREWNARDDSIPDRAPRSIPKGGVISKPTNNCVPYPDCAGINGDVACDLKPLQPGERYCSPPPALCGTIAGIQCPAGFRCELSGSAQDAAGKCVSVTTSGCTADAQCGSGKSCVRYQSYPGNCSLTGTSCAAVITRACKPYANCTDFACTNVVGNECVDFPTPCHVPPGWFIEGSNRTAAPTPTPTPDLSTAALRDAKRKADLIKIKTALKALYAASGTYPVKEPGTMYDYLTSEVGGRWITGLPENYINPMPLDPMNNAKIDINSSTATQYSYWYWAGVTNGPWGGGCATLAKGKYFALAARLETANDPDSLAVKNSNWCDARPLITAHGWDPRLYVITSEMP